jgi:adhesin transport system membrane fusion protein
LRETLDTEAAAATSEGKNERASMQLQPTTASPTQLRIDMMRGPRIAALCVFVLLVAFVIAAVVWSSRAELDEVTSGVGQVIPSSEVQVIQNLEGGIVSELFVQEGDTVDQGQVLLRIDDTAAGASFRETQETYLGVLASVVRLTAEAEGKELEYPDDLARDRPDLVARELELYRTRKAELKSSLAVLGQQKAQRVKELEEHQSRLESLRRSYAFAKEEIDLTVPLVEKGMVSKVDLLRLQRDANELQSQIDASRIAIPRARAAIAEADQRTEERLSNARSVALKELNDRQARLGALQEGLAARKDRVVRTEVRSPVKGIVKQLYFNTIGGVVQPGEKMAEVVPIEDTLLVEAKISPRDVAFVHKGQKALVKLTAYDFSIYGGLDAALEEISPDTILDEQGNSFYQIRVRTDQTHLVDKLGAPMPIIPGMVAEVDILTGKKTVLEYLLKPVLKARHKAMRER